MRRAADRLFTLLFLALLASEGWLRLAGMAAPSSYLVAEPQPFPDRPRTVAATFSYPRRWSRALATQLRLKTPGKALDSAWRYFLFNSSSEEAVIAGAPGWLFDSAFGPGMGTAWPGPDYPDDAALRDQVALLKARQDRLRRAGIPYLVVIAPEKQTVYPELLPAAWRPGRPGARQRFLALAKAGGLAALDLTDAVTAAKTRGPVFLRTDTHWSLLGAWAGYRALLLGWADLRRTDPLLPPPPRPVEWAELRAARSRAAGGDMARLLGMQALLADDLESIAWKARRVDITWQDHFNDAAALDLTRAAGAELVVCGDSFSMDLDQCLALTAGKLVPFVNYQPVPEAKIVAARPRLVIEEFVERRLTQFPVDEGGAEAWLDDADGELLWRVLGERPRADGAADLGARCQRGLYSADPAGAYWTGAAPACVLLLPGTGRHLELALAGAMPRALAGLTADLNGHALALSGTAGALRADVPAAWLRPGAQVLTLRGPRQRPRDLDGWSTDDRELGMGLSAVRLTR